MSLLNDDAGLLSGVSGNTTITGANITSNTGDIDITSRNNTTINASKDTYNNSTKTDSWSENITLGSTTAGAKELDAAINALQMSLSLAMSQSKSDTSSTTYNNSQLTARNGNVNINSLGTKVTNSDTSAVTQSGGDTVISGANILASNVTLNTQGNLTVESKQNSYTQKSKSFGMNLGGGSGNISAGINYSSNSTDRLWTDNQTTIIGTGSVTINTGNNTNLKGAVIANSTNGIVGEGAIDGGNLTLNTKTLTTTNLSDHFYTESSGAGISTSIGTGIDGKNSSQNPNPLQNLNFYPSGSTTLSLNNGSNKTEQTTKATIGNGNITTDATNSTDSPLTLTFDSNGDLASKTGGTLISSSDGTIIDSTQLTNLNRDVTKTQEITKDQITGALDITTTIDNRIFSEKGREQMAKEQKDLGKNLAAETELQLDIAGKVWASPNTVLGLAYGGAGYLYGVATGQDVIVSIGNNAVQFEGNPLANGSSAITLGNSINYFHSAKPDGIWPTYEANDGSWYRMKNINNSVILGAHEMEHTYQGEILGPLFLPTYFFAGVGAAAVNGVITLNPVNKHNQFEHDADVHGNEILKNNH